MLREKEYVAWIEDQRSRACKVYKSKFAMNMITNLEICSFGEDVCQLIFTSSVSWKSESFDMLTNLMTVYLNVFGPFMEYQVGCIMNSSFVVTMCNIPDPNQDRGERPDTRLKESRVKEKRKLGKLSGKLGQLKGNLAILGEARPARRDARLAQGTVSQLRQLDLAGWGVKQLPGSYRDGCRTVTPTVILSGYPRVTQQLPRRLLGHRNVPRVWTGRKRRKGSRGTRSPKRLLALPYIYIPFGQGKHITPFTKNLRKGT